MCWLFCFANYVFDLKSHCCLDYVFVLAKVLPIVVTDTSWKEVVRVESGYIKLRDLTVGPGFASYKSLLFLCRNCNYFFAFENARFVEFNIN